MPKRKYKDFSSEKKNNIFCQRRQITETKSKQKKELVIER